MDKRKFRLGVTEDNSLLLSSPGLLIEFWPDKEIGVVKDNNLYDFNNIEELIKWLKKN
jgi:hypothetical protein